MRKKERKKYQDEKKEKDRERKDCSFNEMA